MTHTYTGPETSARRASSAKAFSPSKRDPATLNQSKTSIAALMSVTNSHQIQGLKLLDGKVAVIYGAAGGVGTAVAKAFAREGATVFLAGRTENSLNLIAREITRTGGVADISKVDALSPESVEAHLHRIVTKTGKLDISFNLIGTNVEMGSKLTELSDQRFAEAAF